MDLGISHHPPLALVRLPAQGHATRHVLSWRWLHAAIGVGILVVLAAVLIVAGPVEGPAHTGYRVQPGLQGGFGPLAGPAAAYRSAGPTPGPSIPVGVGTFGPVTGP